MPFHEKRKAATGRKINQIPIKVEETFTILVKSERHQNECNPISTKKLKYLLAHEKLLVTKGGSERAARRGGQDFPG